MTLSAKQPKSFTCSELQDIITPVLIKMDMFSPAAVQLLIGTCAVESKMGYYRRQMGNGPARGIFQMEPDTEKDIWINYVAYKKGMKDMIKRVSDVDGPNPSALEFNLTYQVVMARLHYRRVPQALPLFSDIKGMANYWKKYYNTVLGAGTVEKFMAAYKLHCGS